MLEFITSADVRELAESKKMIPLMVRWLDTNEIEIIAAVGLHHGNPHGFSDNKRNNDSIINQDELFEIAQKPLNRLTDADCERIAAVLNLRLFRDVWNLSQSRMAEFLGVRQATVSDWESGTHATQHPKLIELALKTLEREIKTEKRRGRRKDG